MSNLPMSVHLSDSARFPAHGASAGVKFAPEFELVLECCRRNFRSAGDEPIRPAEQVDWTRFIGLVRFHGVEGLAWAALADVDLPDRVSAALSADAKAIAAQNLRTAAESSALRSAFEASGIELLFIKGLTLSRLAYGDAFIKMSSDIDVLVDSRDIEKAAEILLQLGLRPLVPAEASVRDIVRWHSASKESAWIRRDSGQIVELHSRLVDNQRLIPGIGMSSPRQEVEIGAGRTLPTLVTDELLAYLFVHGACSAWYRLKWICDVSALLSGMSAEEIERLYRSARFRTAGRAAAQALLLAHHLFGAQVSPSLRDELNSDSVNRMLTSVALRKLMKAREPTEHLGGTAIFHLSRPFLLEGWAFAISELNRQLQDIARRRLFFR